MKIKNQVPLQRLIGKVDNDFNLDESDWIPRSAAWVIDALSQMQCLPMERKRRTLEVADKIAQFPCTINAKEIRVYDSSGCEIPALNDAKSCGCSGSSSQNTESEIAIFDSTNTTGVNFMRVATIVSPNGHNYVLTDNQIELNFETDEITVDSYEVATYFDEYYQCEVPYIYDNGYLLEALSWYILYKYLSRGSKHQIFSLTSNNPALNPYAQWTDNKLKAMRSVKIELSKDNNGWRNFFYNSTVTPRG